MMDRKISEVGTRIRRARESLGEKPAVFATRTGVSRDTLDRYELGKQSPKAEYLAKVAEACGVLEAWLLTGEGPMRRGEDGEGREPRRRASYLPEGRRLDDEYVEIPLWNVAASGGAGIVAEGSGPAQVAKFLSFRRDWLASELHAGPADLYLLYVDGDSMEPTLNPGDVILLRRPERLKDGIYVLRMGDVLHVKRLQFLPGGAVKVTSDNPVYDPFEFRLSAPETELIGRVVWAGKKM